MAQQISTESGVGGVTPGRVSCLDELVGIKQLSHQIPITAHSLEGKPINNGEVNELLTTFLNKYKIFRQNTGSNLGLEDTIIGATNGVSCDFYVIHSSGFNSFDNYLVGKLMQYTLDHLNINPNLTNFKGFQLDERNTRVLSDQQVKMSRGGANVKWFFEIGLKREEIPELQSSMYTVTGNHVFYKTHPDSKIAEIELRIYKALKEAGNSVADAELNQEDSEGKTLIVHFAGEFPMLVNTFGIRYGKGNELKLTFFEDAIKQAVHRYKIVNENNIISDEELTYIKDRRWVTKLIKKFYPSQEIDSLSKDEILEKTNPDIIDDIRKHFDAYRVMEAVQFPSVDHQFKEVFTRLIAAKKESYMKKFGGVVLDEYFGNIACNMNYSENCEIDFNVSSYAPLEQRLFFPISNVKTVRFDFDNPHLGFPQEDDSFMLDYPGNNLSDREYTYLVNLHMDELGIKSDHEKIKYLNGLDFARFERCLFMAGHHIQASELYETSHYLIISTQMIGKIASNITSYWTEEEQKEYYNKYKITVKEDINYIVNPINGSPLTNAVKRYLSTNGLS